MFHHRNRLRNAGLNSAEKGGTPATVASSDAGDSATDGFGLKTGFYGTAVTEVQITSDTPFQFHGSRGSVVLPATPTAPGGRGRPCVLADARGRNDGVKNQQHFTTVCSSDRRPSVDFISRLRSVKSNASLRLKHLDPVKVAYLRTSSIFALAVLITWIPSSVNRLYSLSHGGRVSFQLSVASGCVLPLQGVWNALIYFTTSWGTFTDELKAMGKKLVAKESHNLDVAHPGRSEGRFRSPVEHRDTFERLRHPMTEPVSRQHSDEDLELGHYGFDASQVMGQRR